MGEVWGSTFNYHTSESARIMSNKSMKGVNQKKAPGLSNSLNMKLKRKNGGVKTGIGYMFDCCSNKYMNTSYCIKYLNEYGGC
jgi:hypothetical protein